MLCSNSSVLNSSFIQGPNHLSVGNFSLTPRANALLFSLVSTGRFSELTEDRASATGDVDDVILELCSIGLAVVTSRLAPLRLCRTLLNNSLLTKSGNPCW